MRIVLLPGLHGTTELFRPFEESAPPGFQTQAIGYPKHERLGYEALAEYVRDSIPFDAEHVLVAESFSGPIGIMAAARAPATLRALVLCNSFVSAPISRRWRFFPWVTLFRIPGPTFIIRRFFSDATAPLEHVRHLRRLVLSSDPHVLGHRMHSILELDLSSTLGRVEVPILDLRGSRDRLVPPGHRLRMTALNPGVRTATIDGPHLLLQACPGASWQAIRDFIGCT